MEYLAIIVGVFFIVFLTIKRCNPIIMGIIATSAVAVVSGLPLGEALTDTFFSGFSSMVKSLLPPIFAGCLLCETYTRSGAVVKIADALINVLFKNEAQMSNMKKYAIATLSLILVTGIISYFGINSLVVLIATYPISLRIMERAGIPKRFVMGMLSGGVYGISLSAPGTTEIVNVLGMQVVGTPAHAGLVAGVIAVVVEVTVMTIILSVMINKAVANGETFAYGSKDHPFTGSTEELPSLFISVIPLIVLLVIFNVFSVDIFIATMIGWLLSVVLFWRHLNGKQEFFELCQEGAANAFGPISAVGSLVGVTTVIQSLPAFTKLMESVFSMNISVVLMLIFSVAFVASLTGSSTAAMRLGLPMVLDRCRAAGLADAFIHRVACFASTTGDTLPWAASVMINLSISDMKLEEVYPPMFVTTVIATSCGTAICATIMYFFPFLP